LKRLKELKMLRLVEEFEEQIYKRLPSWTGGVPRQMSEANLARRGGGFPTVSDPVILSKAKDLHHPVSRHSLRSVWIHPSCPGGESWMGSLPKTPVQVFHPDRAKRVSGRGVLDEFTAKKACLVICTRREINSAKNSCPGVSSRPSEASVGKGSFGCGKLTL